MTDPAEADPRENPPSLRQAESEFDRANARARRAVRWLTAASFALALLAFTLPDGAARPLRYALFFAAGVWAAALALTRLPLHLASTPLRGAAAGSDVRYGNVTGAELAAMAAEAAREFEGREQPTIYIHRSELSEACTVNSLFLDSIPSFNAVYLTTKLLEDLKKEEIRAVLLHELAHFHRYIYADAQTAFPMLHCVCCAAAALTWMLGPLGSLYLDVYVMFMLVSVAFLLLRSLLVGQRVERNIEFLCDHFAGARVGRLPMVNALIVMGRGSRRWLGRHSMLSDVMKMLEGRGAVDWAAIDSTIPNGRIEPEEYPRLIRALRETRGAVVVGGPVDLELSSHPSLGRRILFLDEAVSGLRLVSDFEKLRKR